MRQLVNVTCHGGAAQLICDYKGGLTLALGTMKAQAGPKVLLKWAKLGWSGPERVQCGPAGGEVSGTAVQWFRLHYIDGLQLLNLPWPSAGSNVGHRGVRDEKSIGEGWATKIYLTKQGWSSFWSHGHGRVFTTPDWGAEIEFGAQPKKMSWGEA